MLDIRNDISELYRKYQNHYLKFTIEVISRYISYFAFIVVGIGLTSYFISLVAIAILVATYDKNSYQFLDMLLNIFHNDYIYNFYYNYIDSSYTNLVKDYGLSSNIAKTLFLYWQKYQNRQRLLESGDYAEKFYYAEAGMMTRKDYEENSVDNFSTAVAHKYKV
ncbi:hypothetical protein [Francisella philomiragia]|uniref:hypothetical protein n=1 Tax=Francisella philomiragia TaxID=28110 RepID=UPI001B8B66C0|nr:hypothetical protein [Francisella philomiragia]QUE32442.1 hypothetical protein IMS64_09620 [Francisella philomiragia]